jgi:hypothetical protein
VVLQQGEAALARSAQAAQPNGTPQLGEVHPVRRPLLSANQNYTPAALLPLRRQNPREEPGALARRDLCGGARRNPRPYRDRTGRSPFLGRRSASQRLSGQNAKPEIDPTLAELFRAFDERCDALLTLPSVEERRRAAHELMRLLVRTAVSATAQC